MTTLTVNFISNIVDHTMLSNTEFQRVEFGLGMVLANMSWTSSDSESDAMRCSKMYTNLSDTLR